jgi:putative DNA primase/helicase
MPLEHTTNRLLDRLKGVRRDGQGGYMARCPSHTDDRASLHITPRQDRILVHDFGGCPAEAVLSALGLRFSDLRVRR